MSWRARLPGRRAVAVLAFALPAAACSSDPEPKRLAHGTTDAECPLTSPPTYEGFAAPFFTAYCTRCHSSSNVGSARRGAPEGYDWDDRASIRAHAHQIDAVAAAGPSVSNDFMPPSDPVPTARERARLGQWLACEFGQ